MSADMVFIAFIWRSLVFFSTIAILINIIKDYTHINRTK